MQCMGASSGRHADVRGSAARERWVSTHTTRGCGYTSWRAHGARSHTLFSTWFHRAQRFRFRQHASAGSCQRGGARFSVSGDNLQSSHFRARATGDSYDAVCSCSECRSGVEMKHLYVHLEQHKILTPHCYAHAAQRPRCSTRAAEATRRAYTTHRPSRPWSRRARTTGPLITAQAAP